MTTPASSGRSTAGTRHTAARSTDHLAAPSGGAPASVHGGTSRPVGSRLSWQLTDIIVAAVLGVAVGLLFWAWALVGDGVATALKAATPGLAGLTNGVWLIGGVLGGLIVRKPGAAVLVEVLGAVVESLLGSHWGLTAVYSGLAQGLGAELVVAALLYRRFSAPIAMLMGVAAGVCEWLLELFMFGNLQMGAEFNLIYLVTTVISGALIAGLGAWALTRALAATGALDRLASGRAARRV